jgi:hypothetical protein
MGRRARDNDKEKADEASAARDFTMARLAACRGGLSSAVAALDEAIGHFIDSSDDPKGKARSELLEAIDVHIGEAARAIQSAQGSWSDCDPKESEPDPDEDDDDDADEEDEDEPDDD